MNQSLMLVCDRYGHPITARGAVSSKTVSNERSQSREPDGSKARAYHGRIFQKAAIRSPIRRILIPIDAAQVQSADLKPILKVAQRFNAEVTLLHCYECPPSFQYAVGRPALTDVFLHSHRFDDLA
jgi:hypothetical protein